MKNRKQGFTLVEIMIVVMIIGLLAAIALPGFARARTSAQRNACINNLRMLVDAQDQYAIENNRSTADSAVMGDLTPYLRGELVPVCPAGGTYAPGATLGENPTCTLGGSLGHALPTDD